MTLVSKQ